MDALSPTGVSRRLVLVAPSAETILSRHSGLLHEIVNRGHRVLCIAADFSNKDIRELRALGVTHRVIDLDPPGLKLLARWKSVSAFVEIFKDWQPHIVMGIGRKALVPAVLAARRARVRRIVSVLDELPDGSDAFTFDRRFALAMAASQAVVVYNADHWRVLKESGALPAKLDAIVVPGAGVNCETHAALPLPPLDGGVVFLMAVGKPEHSWGFDDFIRAAHALKEKAPATRFIVAEARGTELGPVAISELNDNGDALETVPRIAPAAQALADAHVFVHLARADGMPQLLLEALAAGRPVVTTRGPGCRQTVDEKVNGCLVAPDERGALKMALDGFLHRPGLIPAMGRAARAKAERRFDERAVNKTLLEGLEL